MTKQIILSGIQPTGQMHIGNYFGAIKQWVLLQHQYDCLFMLADMHAITVDYNPKALRDYVRQTAASYIACGIDPDNVSIFVQSAVPQHSELSWIFNCITPLGWLNRMTQFKEKAGKNREAASLGLYSYPVLMAADILLYKADCVPVGEDQKQHLELARDIAGAFNRAYETEYFTLPEPLILEEGARIMGLRDGTKKMSKSDASEGSRINLSDDAETITAKIKKAKSDMVEGINYDAENRPDVANLLTIYALATNQKIEAVTNECANLNFAAFKERLSDALIAHLAPISEKYRVLMQNPAYLDGIINDGNQKSVLIAQKNIKQIKELVGFYH
jgi:tryptophanyl-tRNA synthetase